MNSPTFSNFFFKKNLGQNFIFDVAFLDSIVRELGLSKDDTVVEVGTGAGTLTQSLARVCGRVITYEIDKRLEPVLQERLKDFDNVELHFQDAMKAADFPPEFKLVANIPYYITTPLILKFLGLSACCEICVLVQDDVARRIVASPGGKDYGALSVTLQAQAECRIIKNAPRRMFTPVPGVDSAFVTIRKPPPRGRHGTPFRKGGPLEEEKYDGAGDVFARLVKGMFAARRKTALNALKQAFGFDTETARQKLESCGIDPSVRPEQIPVEKFVKLSQILQ